MNRFWQGIASGFKRALFWTGLTLSFVRAAIGSDSYWINGTQGNYGDAANWKGSVPSAADNAHFANRASPTVDWISHATVSNALFHDFGGTFTLNISNSTWSVLNRLIVDGLTGPTGSVIQTSGTLVITNASGTGSLTVGGEGNQTFTLRGGTLTVDRLAASNSLNAGMTNSQFNFDSGTLN